MAYQSDGSFDETDREAQKERDTQNNANNIRNAADVAIASKNPYAMAAGGAVKAADKITGGKSTEALGKAMTNANRVTPGGQNMQNLSNQMSESGASNAIGSAASMKNQYGGKGLSNEATGSVATATDTTKRTTQMTQNTQSTQGGATAASGVTGENNEKKQGGGQEGSLPSSGGSDANNTSSDSSSDNDDGDKKKSKGIGNFLIKQVVIAIVIAVVPFFLLLLIVVVVVGSVSGVFNDYEDAFGMSDVLGQETGDLEFNPSSEEQKQFYERINNVKLSMQAEGKVLDAMKIVAIYHALKVNDVEIDYKDVTDSVIRSWANMMFTDNYYNEASFRQALLNNIFPQYKPGETKEYYEAMVDEVFDYLDRYYDLVGKKTYGSSCSSIGSCSYNIKGFYIPNRGNVIKNMQISDLKVRLMECGSPYGNGNYTTPIDQDLVNFEDYVAGVAYAEVGPSANEEVLKAQMVAARSFALARPTAMGNGHGKKLEQENGQWILQISSCVADQVFCNIDLGCSYMGGGDGQGGICRSGNVAGAVKTRDPLSADHAIRRAAAATQGEVLVNSQGYIISTGYKNTDQKNWASLAASGLNYKQILLQSYNSGSHNYGASDIEKVACNSSGESSCISTGEFSKWKQSDSQWGSVPMGSSGKTLSQIGCLVTSVSMLVAKSGVEVSVNPWNPGTFVEFLNTHGGINSGGNYIWASVTQAAPSFQYQGMVTLSGMSRDAKFNRIRDIVSDPNVYAVCEVKGNTGQHWVAIDSVTGSTINMMDPSSDATDMWAQYNWANTSVISYYRVG